MLTIKLKTVNPIDRCFQENMLIGYKNKYLYNPYVRKYVFFGIVCSTLSQIGTHYMIII